MAIDNVAYIDADGNRQTANGVTEITASSSSLTDGWYIVLGSDVQTGTLVCNGDVHIILGDGAKLTATGDDSNSTPGIQVLGGILPFAVYAQSTDSTTMGQLIATGGKNAAGIGGGNLGISSDITINGGKVTAKGGDNAAGIGGGNASYSTGITINGGMVIATGGKYGAGIGGGKTAYDLVENITINGGTVTATGVDGGAGIGGGDHSSCTGITINGGIVTANSGYNAAGIGGGYYGHGSNITINGGVVTANGGTLSSGIGGGYLSSNNSNIKVATALVVRADGKNPPATEIEHTSDDDITSSLSGKRYAKIIELTQYAKIIVNAVNNAISETDNDNVKAIATKAITAINTAQTVKDVEAIETLSLSAIASAKAAYTAGKNEILGNLPTDEQDATGHAVTITKGEKSLKLVNPDKVEFAEQ